VPGVRVVKSRDEFEGEIFESLSIIQGSDLPPHAAGAEFEEIERPIGIQIYGASAEGMGDRELSVCVVKVAMAWIS